VLVSGTNGKTTTTKLLAAAVASQGPVVTNLLGANLPTGLVTALASGPPDVPAVLEVDEAWLARVTMLTRPRVVALLNLSRDQLDRNNEVRQVANRWRQMCEQAPPTTSVVANADDPLVAWAGCGARRVTWVGAGLRWRGDATGCPACGGQIVFAAEDGTAGAPSQEPTSPGGAALPGPGWACSSCGFSRPPLDIWLGPVASPTVVVSGVAYSVSLGLPGRCNQANAAMALGACLAIGSDAVRSLGAMAGVNEVAGRYATAQVGGTTLRLLLAKNPAGWAEVFDLLAPPPSPVVVAINARTADGHDPSWLWDVPFEVLRGRPVVATGERHLDLAVRLLYAGVDHARVSSLLDAVSAPGTDRVDVVANYTAFHQLLAQLRPATTAPRADRQAHRLEEQLVGQRTAPGASGAP
jgi:UDP-N-acetylmuramyl tripeptide synthase